jgi:tetratricopeptide (TPR) repeat protein
MVFSALTITVAIQQDHCSAPAAQAPALPAKLLDGMGSSDFKITSKSPEAQRFFNQGISQLYAFWFHEAERSFMQAAALDPEAAMAHWGIALSAAGDFRPAYQSFLNPNARVPVLPSAGSGYARARDAITRARSLKAKVTERERLYIDAMTARHNPRSRRPDDDYVVEMRRLTAAFPEDADARAILALALAAGYEPQSRQPRQQTQESIRLLTEVLRTNPDHVGALHFLMHALEDSGRAREAWTAAERYPALVSAVPHALHMPGHIFVQTGRFEDALRAFEIAAAKERSYKAADSAYPIDHYLHNEHFLIYTLNSLGKLRGAMDESSRLMSVAETPQEREAPDGTSSYRAGWFGLMRTLVRFERWDDILDGRTLPLYRKPREEIWYHWAQGLAHAAKRDTAAARASLARLDEAFERFKRMADPVPRQFFVARMELQARVDNSLTGLQQAAAEERDMLYTEPPPYPRPIREALGQLALQSMQFGTAETAYRALLEREPAGGIALLGLSRALSGLGRTAEAATAAAEFRKAWAGADPELREPFR